MVLFQTLCRLSRCASAITTTASQSHNFGISIRNFASKAEKMGKPKVFFEMAADGQPLGRIIIEVSYIIPYFILYLRSRNFFSHHLHS